MLVVHQSSTFIPERTYITKFLLDDILGINFKNNFENRPDILIKGPNNKQLIIPDILFRTPKNLWLTKKSLPASPLPRLTIDRIAQRSSQWPERSRIPVIFGSRNNAQFTRDFLPIDIFGSAFFMLSRYEEYAHQVEDIHGRFPASASLASLNGFLNWPIVNEYIAILWASLKRLWPGLVRKKRQFRMIPTHDVDIPFEYKGKSLRQILLKSAVDLNHGHGLKCIVRNLSSWHQINRSKYHDPFDTFDWLLDTLEANGAVGVFNFMAGGRLPVDDYYPISAPHITDLIKKVIHRGHAIGFHPSYETATDCHLWSSEYSRLQTAIKSLQVHGGRQHFLRFKVPLTWRCWASSGLEYDSSLGFADHAGFRCGICYEYPVFDLEQRKELPLRERPLIAMDTTVIDSHYMGLGASEEALNYLLDLKQRCRNYDGDFVILWHNQRFVDPKEKEIFQKIIS